MIRAGGAIGEAAIVMLIAEGCTARDVRGEPYEWEQQWTDTVRWHQSLVVFNKTLTGRAIGLAAKARDFLQPRQEARRIVFSKGRGVSGDDAAS